eukprot:gene30575-37814_t
MRRIGVLGLELRHTRLRLFTAGHRLHAGDETAFLDDQFVVGGGGEGEGHGRSAGQGGVWKCVPGSEGLVFQHEVNTRGFFRGQT